MANEDHKEVAIQAGDTVIISATPIPGNERLVHRTINNLVRRGATVMHDRLSQVHVHGHAAQEELKTMLNLTRPRYFVPIHGEYRHLVAHAAIAQSMGVPEDHTFVMEDGDVLELTKHGARRLERVPAGPIYVDGLARWDMSTVVLRDRKMLARDGIVVAFVAVDKATGKVIGEPDVASYGFLDESHKDEVHGKAQELIVETLRSGQGHGWDSGLVQQHMKEALGQYFHSTTKRRPMIVPVAMEL